MHARMDFILLSILYCILQYTNYLETDIAT
jgi:hypothetical protein